MENVEPCALHRVPWKKVVNILLHWEFLDSRNTAHRPMEDWTLEALFCPQELPLRCLTVMNIKDQSHILISQVHLITLALNHLILRDKGKTWTVFSGLKAVRLNLVFNYALNGSPTPSLIGVTFQNEPQPLACKGDRAGDGHPQP